jgi:hypothetical protein
MTNSNRRVIQVDLNADGSLVYTEKSEGDGREKRSHRNANDVFQWTSSVGSLEVTFTRGHPFDQHPIRAEAGQLTPPVQVRGGAELRSYKYDVTLIDKNGVEHHEDPVIVIHEDEGEFADGGLETLAQ